MSLQKKSANLLRLIRHRRECLGMLDSIALQSYTCSSNTCRPQKIKIDQGTTTDEELGFLTELIRESAAEPGPIIEIGTLFGFTTIEMALSKAPDRTLITVDMFAWNPWGLTSSEHRRLTERILHVPIEILSVKLVACSKDAFYQSYDGITPSIVFLDAIHTYDETKKDIEWALGTGCRLVAGHDYCRDFQGVIQAVNEHGTPELRGTVWLLRK